MIQTKTLAIHQFSPSAHKGDGITNGMFYLQKILQELGFTSYIYAENFENELNEKVYHYSSFDKQDATQILFIHYSIYYDFNIWINQTKARKLMIYHNITPYTFFEKDSFLYNMCKAGKEYLPQLSTVVEGSIGDSALNTEELLKHNFQNVKTIPLLMDIDSITNSNWNKELFDEKSLEFNIIFVGRIARNKAQHDLIEIANIYRNMSNDFKMYIIGSTTDLSYYQELQELILHYNLQHHVILTGKISNEDLYAYYRSANLFLCMSEHEGFGIPLIESMLFDLPIIAYNSSNIKSTLNSGGILFNEKSPKHITATIKLLRENTSFKTEVLNTQRKAKEIYAHDIIVKELVEYLSLFNIKSSYKAKEKKEKIKYQFEGPFDSSYSLAMLNRYSALAFEHKYPNQVSLFSTEGGGDFEANQNFLNEHPLVKNLAQKSQKALQSQVVFRNLYPPRVTGMKGELNILNSYGWEESGFVKEYIDAFNQNLDAITVMSKYVRDVLLNNGITIPIAVVGLGAEHILKAKPTLLKLDTQKNFKFLHISSCFPRKGIDILLKAYSESFTKSDDVSLIIKTFPNPHNDVETQIELIEASNPNAPEIVLINEDLNNSHISWLYQNTDCLVAPSRGEGFGLPMAEAMLFNLPVITTAFGGQTDFCKNDNSWLIDYSFQKAKTHLNVFNSYWVEPNFHDLKRVLKEQLTLTQEEKQKKTEKAYALISNKFRWKDYVEKTDNFIKHLKNREVFNKETKTVAWISSFNTKCGIATYSDFILNQFNQNKFNIVKLANYTDKVLDDTMESQIIRCWNNRFDEDNNKLIQEVIKSNAQHVLINFNFGFFSMKNLEIMINTFTSKSINITIIFHSVADINIKGLEASLSTIKETLKNAKLLVHNIDDLNHLKKISCINIHLLPHGVQNRENNPILHDNNNFTISSYGFLLPHKGILELIEAFSILLKSYPNTKLLLLNAIYPAPDSQTYFTICEEKVKALNLSKNVKMITDFLTDEESFKFLDTADLLVLPYKKTNESSSAAVRYALSTRKPVLCTKQSIFNDVEDVVHFSTGYSPQKMASAMMDLMADKDLLSSKTTIQNRWIREHDWKNIAIKIENHLLF